MKLFRKYSLIWICLYVFIFSLIVDIQYSETILLSNRVLYQDVILLFLVLLMADNLAISSICLYKLRNIYAYIKKMFFSINIIRIMIVIVVYNLIAFIINSSGIDIMTLLIIILYQVLFYSTVYFLLIILSIFFNTKIIIMGLYAILVIIDLFDLSRDIKWNIFGGMYSCDPIMFLIIIPVVFIVTILILKGMSNNDIKT